MTAGCSTYERIRTFLLVAVLVVLSLRVAPAQGVSFLGSNQTPFPREVVLRPELVPYDLQSDSCNLWQTNAPFLKEPELSPRHVFRRVLHMGEDTNNVIALIWDQPKRMLYLDLNRNLDLTDDPTGAFSSTNTGFEQCFTNVLLPLRAATGLHPATVDLELSADETTTRARARLRSRSLWQAKVTIQGEDWQVTAVDDFFGPEGPKQAEYLLLRPWAMRTNQVSLRDSRSGLVSFPDQLFWLGQAFHLECHFDATAQPPVCKLELTPQQPPLTEVTLSGDSLYYAVLRATNGYTAVLRGPAGTLKVPQGVYAVSAVWLKKGATEAFRFDSKGLALNATSATQLVLGGPLTNSVVVDRYGRRLLLNYQLIGADGGRYWLAEQDRARPPEFAVYRGGKKVLVGKFQYG